MILRSIHYRFVKIFSVRAARDDRIVGVVDECEGQSLLNDCKGGKMCKIDRVRVFNDNFTSFILRKSAFRMTQVMLKSSRQDTR